MKQNDIPVSAKDVSDFLLNSAHPASIKIAISLVYQPEVVSRIQDADMLNLQFTLYPQATTIFSFDRMSWIKNFEVGTTILSKCRPCINIMLQSWATITVNDISNIEWMPRLIDIIDYIVAAPEINANEKINFFIETDILRTFFAVDEAWKAILNNPQTRHAKNSDVARYLNEIGVKKKIIFSMQGIDWSQVGENRYVNANFFSLLIRDTDSFQDLSEQAIFDFFHQVMRYGRFGWKSSSHFKNPFINVFDSVSFSFIVLLRFLYEVFAYNYDIQKIIHGDNHEMSYDYPLLQKISSQLKKELNDIFCPYVTMTLYGFWFKVIYVRNPDRFPLYKELQREYSTCNSTYQHFWTELCNKKTDAGHEHENKVLDTIKRDLSKFSHEIIIPGNPRPRNAAISAFSSLAQGIYDLNHAYKKDKNQSIMERTKQNNMYGYATRSRSSMKLLCYLLIALAREMPASFHVDILQALVKLSKTHQPEAGLVIAEQIEGDCDNKIASQQPLMEAENPPQKNPDYNPDADECLAEEILGVDLASNTSNSKLPPTPTTAVLTTTQATAFYTNPNETAAMLASAPPAPSADSAPGQKAEAVVIAYSVGLR